MYLQWTRHYTLALEVDGKDRTDGVLARIHERIRNATGLNIETAEDIQVSTCTRMAQHSK